MTATPTPNAEEQPFARLPRFDAVERALHWVNAALFAALLATAAALYFGSVSAVVGRRELVRAVHVYAGLALPVPVLVSALGRWGAGVRADLRRLNRWTADERRWLRSGGRDLFVNLGKFNPGQKLNAAFTGGAIVVMLATGSIMRWYHPFPLRWRTGATFVHDWVAAFVFVVIVGHVSYALRDRDALRAMVRGWVPTAWARRRAPAWHAEMTAPDNEEPRLTRTGAPPAPPGGRFATPATRPRR